MEGYLTGGILLRLKADGESGGQIRDSGSGQWEEGIQGLHQRQKSFVLHSRCSRETVRYYPCAPARAAESRSAEAAPIHSWYEQYKAKAARGKGWAERGCQVGTRMQELE